MSKDEEFKKTRDKFQSNIKTVCNKWGALEKNLDTLRQQIEDDFFTKNPFREQLFSKPLPNGEEPSEEAVRKKKYKHSVAVINFLEAIVRFAGGNEESKPILFVLGRQHKHISVSQKMFIEMKESICRVVEELLDEDTSSAWGSIIEYIYNGYVFPGMHLIETIT